MADETGSIGRAGASAKGVARRQEILDRATELFAERGSEGASLRSIAQAIGVSHAALLHYFDSREQLLLAVYDRAEKRRDEMVPLPPDARAVDVLLEAAVANAEVPGLVSLYTLLVASSLEASHSATREHFTNRFEALRQGLTARIAREQEDGTLRSDIPAADAAALIIAASDGLQVQWLLEPSLELRRTLDSFARLLAP